MIQKIKCLLGMHNISTKTAIVSNHYIRGKKCVYVHTLKIDYCTHCKKILYDGENGFELIEIKEAIYD